MRERPRYRPSAGDVLRSAGSAIPKLAVAGLFGWVGYEIISNLNPVHVSIHDFSTSNWNYGWHTGVSVDHVSGSQLTNGHSATALISKGDVYISRAGTEYTVHDSAPGSNIYFDVLLDKRSPIANYQFQPGHTYDLQGQDSFNELVGHTADGKDIVVQLIDVNKIVDEGSSAGSASALAPLAGGLIGTINGAIFSPKMPMTKFR